MTPAEVVRLSSVTPRLRPFGLTTALGWLVGGWLKYSLFSTPIRDSLPIGRERVDTP
jgi:hypothetical protein